MSATYAEKCSCGASVHVEGSDWYQLSFGVDRWLKAHAGCRPGVAAPLASDFRSSLTPEWCMQAFYRVNPGAKDSMPGGIRSLYLLDFARAVETRMLLGDLPLGDTKP